MRIILTLFAVAIFLPQLLEAQTVPAEWDLHEELRITTTGADDSLATLGHLTVSPDGNELFVTQPTEQAILVFDAETGMFRGRIGSRGGRAREFQQIRSIGWVADTLYVTDRVTKRVSLFAATGEHLATMRISPPIQEETAYASSPIGLTSEGRVIAELPFPTRALNEGVVTPSPWALLERDGTMVDTLAMRDLRGTTGVFAVPNGRAVFVQPLSQRDHLALNPDGTSIVIVHQPAGSDAPGRYEVTRLQADATPVYIKSYSYTPKRVSLQDADRLRDEILDSMRRRPSGLQNRETLAKYIEVPDFLQPVSGVVVGRDHTVWLRTAADENGLIEWIVIGPTGEVTAALRLPPAVDIRHADEDIIWATVTSESGTVSLLRARLQR